MRLGRGTVHFFEAKNFRGFRARAVCAFGKTVGMRYGFVFTVDLRIDFFGGKDFFGEVLTAACFSERGEEDFLAIENEVR